MVLVVDDEEPIRTLVRGYLEREGIEVLNHANSLWVKGTLGLTVIAMSLGLLITL
jgi:DNA-binding response OmpR family regulator